MHYLTSDSQSSIGERPDPRTLFAPSLHRRRDQASKACPATASTNAEATKTSMLTAATASWNHNAMLASPKVEIVLILFFWTCKEQRAN
jgi:hypothetical protein